MLTDFQHRSWPKTPRLYDAKGVVITEKIDGRNCAVYISEDGQVGAQSRNNILTHDEYGFYNWVKDNANALANYLGPGYHYGEWWGYKIGRGYDCKPGERYFSLFNTHRWADVSFSIPNLTTVPIIYDGVFSEHAISNAEKSLKEHGSYAKPGFKRPEGVVLYHKVADKVFKVILDK